MSTLEKLQAKTGEKEKVISPDDAKLQPRDNRVDRVPQSQDIPTLEKQASSSSEKPQEISPDMKMNVQLMNGELPQCYTDLLTRFTVHSNYLQVINL